MATNLETILIGVGVDASKARQGAQEYRKHVNQMVRDTDALGKSTQQAEKQGSAAFSALSLRIAALAVIWKTANFVKETTLLAARFETLGVVMDTVGRNAGYSADQLDYLSDSVRGMGITLKQSRDTIISMAQAQLDLTQAASLARLAQDAAVIGNINSSEALNRLIYGIKSAQVEVLRTIGLNVSFERSYAELAAELGKTVDSLSETEKAQARLQETFKAGELISSVYANSMNTAGKQVASLARYVEDAKTKLGTLFQGPFRIFVKLATDSLKEINAELDKLISKGGIGIFGEILAAGQAGADIFQKITDLGGALSKSLKGWDFTPLRAAVNDLNHAIRTAEESKRKAIEDEVFTVSVPRIISDQTTPGGLPAFETFSIRAQNAQHMAELQAEAAEFERIYSEALGVKTKEREIVNEISLISSRQLASYETQLRNSKSLTNELALQQELETGSLQILNESLGMTEARRDAEIKRINERIKELEQAPVSDQIRTELILLNQERQSIEASNNAREYALTVYDRLIDKARELDDITRSAIDFDLSRSQRALEMAEAGRRGGFISDIARENRMDNIRAQEILDTRKRISDIQNQGASQPGGIIPEQLAEINNLEIQIIKLQEEMDGLAKTFDDRLVDASTEFFTSVIAGTESAGDAFRRMISSMISDLARLATQNMFKSLFSGSSPGSMIAGLLGAFPGGAATSVKAVGSQSAASYVNTFFPGNASGASFMVPGGAGIDSTLVAFRASPGERVDVSTPVQNRGGSPVTINLNIQSDNGYVSRETQSQMISRLTTALSFSGSRA